MELRLYNSLKFGLLGGLVAASERHDAAYQKAVEAYGPESETGIKKWARDSIADWLARYNQLVNRPVRLRYYQILALYFTEAVLRDVREQGADRGAELNGLRRNMLAYWMATGSGKTLLMHLNILQYIDHIGGMQAFDELQIIVTTPGVNLIDQHRRELTPLVDALNRQCANRIKLTVESTGSLLNHERGYFNLPPSSRVFRLVLVDEGHIGLAGGGKDAGAFKTLRHNLADFPNAFLFEYSATYHGISDKHVAEYSDQIVYDYNYYRFYKDGYGKDYSIQKVASDGVAKGEEAWTNFQLAFETLADKLSVHEELRLTDHGLGFVSAFADKPLIAFMGNTVEDKKKEGKGDDDEVSDIRKLLAYLAKLSSAQRLRLASVFNGDHSGHLTLTRCAAVTDEIYLSWGDGAYWGIVNVGNGDKFFNESEGHPELKDAHGLPLVQLRKAPIVERRFQFGDIDLPGSPINVLVGSRKFAEGWNCYRVSVIGLINLGSSKGNKIIQIFGRGVRLKGLQADGKRRFIAHGDDYDALIDDDTPENRLRRLETLNVFSLKSTYLEVFLKGLEQEMPRWVLERRVPVQAQSLKLGRSSESFDQYAAKLPIFKVGRDETEPRLLATLTFQNGEPKWQWSYFHEETEESGELARFSIHMDVRPDVTDTSHNLAQHLRDAAAQGAASFFPLTEMERRLHALQRGRRMQLLVQEASGLRPVSLLDVLRLVDRVDYHRSWSDSNFSVREQLLSQTLTEAMSQLHNKLIYDLNKRRYRIGEPLRQSSPGAPGDFVSHYDLRLEFGQEADKQGFERQFPSPQLPTQLPLDLLESRHIYAPLFQSAENKGVTHGLRLKTLSISPDALNPGERKFVQDIHNFLANPVNQGRLRAFDFYLMRNVESLRSVGVYLETETRAYYPDFVLWAVSDKKTHVMLVDPKGQSGIQDWNSLEAFNAKVAIAKNGDLVELANKLTSHAGKAFAVDSFILLRKSSPLGQAKGDYYNEKEANDMEKLHVLHLNWSPVDEHGNRVDEAGDYVPLPPEGRCYVERMLACAGVL